MLPQEQEGLKIREYLLASTDKAVRHFLAGLDVSPENTASGMEVGRASYRGDVVERVAKAVESRSTPLSKEMCLLMCAEAGRSDLLERGLEYLRRNGGTSRGMEYLHTELALFQRDFQKAWDDFTCHHGPSDLTEYEVPRLRQLVRICRLWKRPQRALPWLADWLSRFPDSPSSGQMWLSHAVLAIESGKDDLDEATISLKHAKALLGPVPAVRKVEERLWYRRVSSMFPEE